MTARRVRVFTSPRRGIIGPLVPSGGPVIHDSAEDVYDARRPTSAQAEVIELLDLNPEGRPLALMEQVGKR